MRLPGLGSVLGGQGPLSSMNRNNFNQQGIGQFLSPLISAINQDYSQDVVQPYVQQVENLTASTFPDFNMGGSGMGMPDFGGRQVGFGGQIGGLPTVSPGDQVGQISAVPTQDYMKDMLNDMRLKMGNGVGSDMSPPISGIFNRLTGG